MTDELPSDPRPGGLPPGVETVLASAPASGPGASAEAGPAGGLAAAAPDPGGFAVGRETAVGLARRFWRNVGTADQRRVMAAGRRAGADVELAASVAAEFAFAPDELDNWAELSADALDYLRLNQFANPVLALGAMFAVRQVFIGLAVSSFKRRKDETTELRSEPKA